MNDDTIPPAKQKLLAAANKAEHWLDLALIAAANSPATLALIAVYTVLCIALGYWLAR